MSDLISTCARVNSVLVLKLSTILVRPINYSQQIISLAETTSSTLPIYFIIFINLDICHTSLVYSTAAQNWMSISPSWNWHNRKLIIFELSTSYPSRLKKVQSFHLSLLRIVIFSGSIATIRPGAWLLSQALTVLQISFRSKVCSHRHTPPALVHTLDSIWANCSQRWSAAFPPTGYSFNLDGIVSSSDLSSLESVICSITHGKTLSMIMDIPGRASRCQCSCLTPSTSTRALYCWP